ncbi:MAG: integrin [Burkholderiales bacterium]
MPRLSHRFVGLRLVGMICGLLAIAGCGGGGGGGGGGGDAPPASTGSTQPSALSVTSPKASIRQVNLAWSANPDATAFKLLFKPNATAAFTQIGADLPGGSTTAAMPLAVHRTDWVNGRLRVDACNAVGCTPSNEVGILGSMLDAIGYFKASNTEAGDLFGVGLALSGDGNTLAVGAPLEASNATGIGGDQANNSASRAGAVYVLTRTGGTWTQQAYLKASNAMTTSVFGIALSLSSNGNTLAVGASGESSNARGVNGDQGNFLAPRSGAVYVFSRTGTTWSQQAYLKASNTGPSDSFGEALALSADGNTLAVGASLESSSATGVNQIPGALPVFFSGAVYVFSRTGTSWSHQAYVKASNTGTEDRFGAALALSGDGSTLAVGAQGEGSSVTGINQDQADNSAGSAGAVYVFVRSGTTWQQQAYIKASNTERGDAFGGALALNGDGNTLAVGARFESSNATGINGNQANNTALSSGAAYVFLRTGTIWAQQAYLKASNTRANGFFSIALRLSGDGNTLAAGASGESSGALGINGSQSDTTAPDSGSAYVFVRSGATWVQQAYVKASNTGASDSFGSALGLSTDGSALAVGATFEKSSATGVGGNRLDASFVRAGAVFLY